MQACRMNASAQNADRGGMKVPAVVWFTGLSGSGKSTVANALAGMLAERGVDFEHLDGDAIRSVFPATGFTRQERDAHIRRVGYAASLLEKHGVTVLVTLVSPYRESRDFARGLCRRFVEVYVATPLDVCEKRDAKGLYARARRGEIALFTGISDPYEPPVSPELVINTAEEDARECARRILEHLEAMR